METRYPGYAKAAGPAAPDSAISHQVVPAGTGASLRSRMPQRLQRAASAA